MVQGVIVQEERLEQCARTLPPTTAPRQLLRPTRASLSSGTLTNASFRLHECHTPRPTRHVPRMPPTPIATPMPTPTTTSHMTPTVPVEVLNRLTTIETLLAALQGLMAALESRIAALESDSARPDPTPTRSRPTRPLPRLPRRPSLLNRRSQHQRLAPLLTPPMPAYRQSRNPQHNLAN